MKSVSLIRKLFAALLIPAVLWTVSIHEVHYLFTEHAAVHERCDNHLHDSDKHNHCNICKFDISLFTDDAVANEATIALPVTPVTITHYSSPILISVITANTLRGPPARV